jgi:hypothetical protein
MTAAIQTLLLLVAVLVVVAIVARRFNIAPPILLVIAGILFALAPGLPRIELAPELVLLGILPPLIYSAGVAMSWREFRFNLRPIALLAFGYVVFTTGAVAAAAHWLLGMPLAVAFVLGAIVSPTDAVAPVSIMRQMGVPRRLIVILEGEGLANDATALILYRFAVAAAGTGLFSLGQAAGTFVLIVVGEIAFGIWHWLAELALATLGARPSRRDHAILADALCRVSDPRPFRRIGRFGDDDSRPVRELERAAAHSGGDAAARNLLLGRGCVFAQRNCVPRDWPADANAARSNRHGPVVRLNLSRTADRGGGYRSTVYVDLSGGLHTSLAQPIACTAGPGSALAMALLSCVCRGARRCFARSGTSDSTDHRNWHAVSVPESHPLRHARCHCRDLGGPGIAAAWRCSMAWVSKPRCRRA